MYALYDELIHKHRIHSEKLLLLLETSAHKLCEKFGYKYSKTIEYVKNQPNF